MISTTPRFHVEELYGEDVVASNIVEAPDALSAAQNVIGKAISPRSTQEHWFRIVDEAQGTVHEFSLEDDESTADGGR